MANSMRAKDNVILITHFFSGNSHAAGKYSEDDPQAGYWDAPLLARVRQLIPINTTLSASIRWSTPTLIFPMLLLQVLPVSTRTRENLTGWTSR